VLLYANVCFDYSTNKVITHEEKNYCSSAIDILYIV